MTNDERNPKSECRKALRGAGAGFVIWILSFLRIWSFVIRILCSKVHGKLPSAFAHALGRSARRLVARASRPCVGRHVRTGETPVPLRVGYGKPGLFRADSRRLLPASRAVSWRRKATLNFELRA